MPTNIPSVPRRSERRPAAIPIRLVLEAANFKADNSAITTDISADGVGVRTTLALSSRRVGRIYCQGEIPSCHPYSCGLGEGR